MMNHQSFSKSIGTIPATWFFLKPSGQPEKNGGRKRREILTTHDDTIGWPSQGLSEAIRMRFEFWMHESAYVNTRYGRVVVQRQLCRRSHPAKGTADRFRDLWSIDLRGF